jgi:PfaD family protein
MARAGMLGFFGAAGLPPPAVEKAIDEIERGLPRPDAAFGVNLIHSPQEPQMEAAMVDLLLRRKVRRASASAFMSLTPSVVRYACTGLKLSPKGRVQRTNHLFPKISRPEVARHFLSPAPAGLLSELVGRGQLTREEAELAQRVPLADEITVEADSGGHTDNRPLVGLIPLILALRDELSAKHGYERPIAVGAGGGIGTPASVAAAFSLGAAYVMTGSINQSSLEAGTSKEAKQMLAQAGIADCTMAPAADMFELGVKVQVLKRGTLFAARAQKLYELYTSHGALEEIPEKEREEIERDLFRAPLSEIWGGTKKYWEQRDPEEAHRAEKDPKHRMALVFRWYLGSGSRWARAGDASRKADYQVWCGPAMGAFNAWVAGSFLEALENRSAEQIAKNLLAGATVLTRAQQLRSYGLALPPQAFAVRPQKLD